MKQKKIMEEKGQNLTELFESSLLSDEKKEVLTIVGDVCIDSMITDGALDGIPILGVLNGVYKMTKNIQTNRLCKKVASFLFGTLDITQENIDKFIQEYTEANQEKGAEALLAVIDKIDNYNKIGVLCNLMKAKIKGDISIENFIRLCQVTERLPYVDFQNLEKYKVDYSELGMDDVMLSSGVVFKSVIETSGDKYKLNYMGKLLLKFGLHIEISLDAPSPVSMPNTLTADSLDFGEY